MMKYIKSLVKKEELFLFKNNNCIYNEYIYVYQNLLQFNWLIIYFIIYYIYRFENYNENFLCCNLFLQINIFIYEFQINFLFLNRKNINQNIN